MTVEAFVHTSLDLYAFIAITASSSTLHDLIEVVKVDNNRRQQDMDETGHVVPRMLNVNTLLISACQSVTLISYMTQFGSSSFTNPEYELVAIHPEHFLPCGNVLPVFCSATSTSTPTIYISARDRRLRESPSPDSPRLSTFRHVTGSRIGFHRLNVFLVIMNAEIKFHRYLRMISQNPPTTPLPDDVLDLMYLTVELVDLIYWRPVPTKGSQGEVFAEMIKRRQRNPPRTMRSDTAKTIERGSSGVRETVGDEEMDNRTRSRRSDLAIKRKFANMDLETRMAYGRALMSGHGALPSLSSSRIQSIELFEYVHLDLDYDPALFEDAIPINDGVFFLCL